MKRHLQQLDRIGIDHVSIVVGYLAEQVAAEAQAANSTAPLQLITNPNFRQGSALSLLAAADDLRHGPVLVMDADLLYAPELLDRLIACPHENCLLVDGALDDSGEEVKAVARDGRVRELGKTIAAGGAVVGESVGIFKFGPQAGARLAALLEIATRRNAAIEYEPVIDQLLKELETGYACVDGLPWIEIDFWHDVERARDSIAPALVG
jgi:choline kinase